MNSRSDRDQDVVRYEANDAIAVITFDRPERLNAITPQLEREYFDYLEHASSDPSVRVIVVTGAGRGFCAGADMDILDGLGRGEPGSSTGRPQSFPMSVPKPIIACINGPCAGLGLVWSLMADLRFASTTAKFTTSFVRRGLIAEHGISWLLPRIVGLARAMDLLLSGRVVLGSEAYAMGLVNQVMAPDELLAGTLAYAAELAESASPTAIAVMKQQIYRDAAAGFEDAREVADRLMVESLRRPDFREGVASFAERRLPLFDPIATSEPEFRIGYDGILDGEL